MNIEELKYQILQQFGFPPTPEQAQALDVFVQFMTDSNPHAVMILRHSDRPAEWPPESCPHRFSSRQCGPDAGQCRR